MAQSFLYQSDRYLPAKKILLVANTAWNLWNYRLSLIRALQKEGYTVFLAAPEDRFLERLQANTGADFIPLRQLSRSSLSPVQNIRSCTEFYRVFQQVKPDIVMLYTIKPNILGNFAAAIARVPVISVLEGLGYSGSTAARWRWIAAPLYRLALRKARWVIFLNRDDETEFLERRIVSGTQAVTIPGPGIDLAYFQMPENAPAGPLVFLFSGRFLGEKGIREFAAAARVLKQENAAAEFRILGAPDSGNPNSVKIEEVESWVREGFLTYLGRKEEVRPALKAAHVLVLPTYYREGVPRSVLEGMAMGKIILTTNTPGCRDTVEEGYNGFLVPPRNIPELAAAMRHILQLTDTERSMLGIHSRLKVEKEFSDELVIPRYLDLLTALINAPANSNTLRRSPRS